MSTGAATVAGVPLPPVRVDVLGPLRLAVDGEAVDVPGPKRRALLALLAMSEGRSIAADDLLEALWPDGLPDAARASLHSHVSRLRGHLGERAALLENLGGAYRLELDPAAGTDVAHVRTMLATLDEREPATSHRLLREARGLWRGTPLAEFAEVAPLAARAVALDDLRRSVEQRLVTAALAAGAFVEAVEVASALVSDDPLSEAAVLALMRALDGSGRPAEALRVGHDHRLRLSEETGLEPTPALAELESAVAVRAGSGRRGMPRPTTRLRGRDSELAALHRLLSRERLVSVIGPGGVGKTRLVTEVAARADHVVALLLASVADDGAIPHALAEALDLRVAHGDVLGACAALLGAGHQLLVVDNCEHLLAGVGAVVGNLLDACPELQIVATSREPLGLPAEQRLRIAPLAVRYSPHRESSSGAFPDDGHAPDLTTSPAVGLFVDRARRVRGDFAPDSDERLLIAEIVRRLDGMPLAIELAAGRLSSLELTDLHARLDRSLDLLGDGRDVTLRRTIEWSYDLLPGPEQQLFCHLGAFPDGFDLSTAEAVADEMELRADAAGAVAHLVDASMVEADLGPTPRYRMLDTIRTFALSQLEAKGEAALATERFVQQMVRLAGDIHALMLTDAEPDGDRLLRRELANFRAAWRWLREHGRLDDAVRVVWDLGDPAGWRELTEIWSWILELADDPVLEGHPAEDAVVGLAAVTAWSRSELDRAETLAARGCSVGGSSAWQSHSALATVALSRGRFAEAVEHGTRCVPALPNLDSGLGVAALAAAYDGDHDRAVELSERMEQRVVSPTLAAFHRYVTGEIAMLQGATARAEQHYEQAVVLARRSGATFIEGLASVGLVTLLARTGREAAALDRYHGLIEYWELTGAWVQQWTTLRNLAELLAALGDRETAWFLTSAARLAPDAPGTGDRFEALDPQMAAERASAIEVEAARASRTHVLEVARDAIERHRSGR